MLAVDGLEWERWIDLFIKADQLNVSPAQEPRLLIDTVGVHTRAGAAAWAVRLF